MEGSRTSLAKWHTVIELLSDKKSVNAVQLALLIQVTYKTAWSILHKIRRAISELDEDRRLAGYVTGGVVFYGRPQFAYYRTEREHPLWVSCAQEREVRRDNNFERDSGLYVKIKRLTDHDLIGQKLAHSGETRLFEEHLEGQAVGVTLNRAEFRRNPLLFPLYKEAEKWINQTFRGIGGKYQQAYWDEFCFRVNYMHHVHPVSHILASVCMGNFEQAYRRKHAS
ncbi:hypothetical protein XYCOK13_38580 [Xylanibacillus composti]|uniref:Uncharacterized protein n=2 Tax=Xylanibacillus composti TaxID=1572762 RepID=A0A8J4H8I9_9BACL|nr:hypothetical protein XYCOK13_38580 [Xylanibacillus composti]